MILTKCCPVSFVSPSKGIFFSSPRRKGPIVLQRKLPRIRQEMNHIGSRRNAVPGPVYITNIKFDKSTFRDHIVRHTGIFLCLGSQRPWISELYDYGSFFIIEIISQNLVFSQKYNRVRYCNNLLKSNSILIYYLRCGTLKTE